MDFNCTNNDDDLINCVKESSSQDDFGPPQYGLEIDDIEESDNRWPKDKRSPFYNQKMLRKRAPPDNGGPPGMGGPPNNRGPSFYIELPANNGFPNNRGPPFNRKPPDYWGPPHNRGPPNKEFQNDKQLLENENDSYNDEALRLEKLLHIISNNNKNDQEKNIHNLATINLQKQKDNNDTESLGIPSNQYRFTKVAENNKNIIGETKSTTRLPRTIPIFQAIAVTPDISA